MSQVEEPVMEALRNLKTGKLFIFLEVLTPPSKVRVINPNGDVLAIPETIFDDEPLQIPESEYAAVFTPEQLASYDRYMTEVAAEPRREVLVMTSKSPEKTTRAPRTSRGRTSGLRGTAPTSRGRIVSQWNASRLTFYRHKIEHLQLRDSFLINVDNEGEYVMTKQEFQDMFNDVLLNAEYKRQGLFSYASTPEKAKKFLRR